MFEKVFFEGLYFVRRIKLSKVSLQFSVFGSLLNRFQLEQVLSRFKPRFEPVFQNVPIFRKVLSSSEIARSLKSPKFSVATSWTCNSWVQDYSLDSQDYIYTADKPSRFNSPGTELFPFSYFDFCLLAFSQVIKDIKNLITAS